MASVTVVVAGQPRPVGAHPHATISWDRGARKLTVPVVTAFGFDEVWGVNWAELDRPGRLPLTVYGGDKLSRATLEVKVVDPADSDRSIEPELSGFRALAKNHTAGALVIFGSAYRYTTAGYWLVDSMSITPIRWRHGDNEITEADVVLGLKTAMLPDLAF